MEEEIVSRPAWDLLFNRFREKSQEVLLNKLKCASNKSSDNSDDIGSDMTENGSHARSPDIRNNSKTVAGTPVFTPYSKPQKSTLSAPTPIPFNLDHEDEDEDEDEDEYEETESQIYDSDIINLDSDDDDDDSSPESQHTPVSPDRGSSQSASNKALQPPTPKIRKTKESLSKKAGLTFPVGRVLNQLKTRYSNMPRISKESAVYMTAVLEYLSYELCLVAADQCTNDKRKRIKSRDIFRAIKNDEEFDSLIGKISQLGSERFR